MNRFSLDVECGSVFLCQRRPSTAILGHIWTTHGEFLVVSSTVQFLVIIDAIVSI